MPKHGVTTAATRKRMVEELRVTARFGNFPIPDDMSPVDVLVDELKRSAGFCFWIESKMAEWDDELVMLQTENIDDKGSMQIATNNKALWMDIWQRERAHLAKVAKMCLDAGVDQRRVELAEKQASVMFMLINEAFDMLKLSPEQKAAVPQIMPALIRQLALPKGDGHAVA